MNVNWFHQMAMRRHMPEVVRQSTERRTGWDEDDFMAYFCRRDCRGWVCETVRTGEVLGFLMFVEHKECLDLLYVHTSLSRERQGVGTAMLERMLYQSPQMTTGSRNAVVCDAPENATGLHCFLRKNGFKARQPNERDRDLGCYHFVWRRSPDVVFEDPADAQVPVEEV